MDKFSLILHPHTWQDYVQRFPVFDYLPKFVLQGVTRVLPPFKVSDIKGIQSSFAQVEGELLCCPLLTEQLQELPLELVLKKIIRAVKLAERNGAKLVGLGTFASVMSEGGVSVAQATDLPLTTGASYTLFMALEGLKKVAKLMGIEGTGTNVVILGATGSLGNVCARLLAQENGYLTLVASQRSKLEKLAAQILYETGLAVKITVNIKEALRKADIVMAVTSAFIEPQDVKAGAIVYDLARPRNNSLKAVARREDVLVIEEALVTVPGGAEFNFDFGFSSGQCYACLAEVIILALEKRYESFSLGSEVTFSQVQEIGALAQKHGFKLAGLSSSGQNLTRNKIEKTRKNAARIKLSP